MQVGISKLGSTEIHLSTRVSKLMGILPRQPPYPEATTRSIPAIPRRVFCILTRRRPGASSTRHRRFPGAKGARLHSSNTVATELVMLILVLVLKDSLRT